MLPVRLSLNIKDESDGEHLRLIVVPVLKRDKIFEASVTLIDLFSHCLVLCCLCMLMWCIYMCFSRLCSPLFIFVKTSLKALLRLTPRGGIISDTTRVVCTYGLPPFLNFIIRGYLTFCCRSVINNFASSGGHGAVTAATGS